MEYKEERWERFKILRKKGRKRRYKKREKEANRRRAKISRKGKKRKKEGKPSEERKVDAEVEDRMGELDVRSDF